MTKGARKLLTLNDDVCKSLNRLAKKIGIPSSALANWILKDALSKKRIRTTETSLEAVLIEGYSVKLTKEDIDWVRGEFGTEFG